MSTNICKALLLLFVGVALAAPPTATGMILVWTGTGSGDTTTVIDATAEDGAANLESCMLKTTAGNVTVALDLGDGVFSTVALSLIDNGAVDNNPVAATAATGRVYSFPVNAVNIRVKQSGVTQATAVLACRKSK